MADDNNDEQDAAHQDSDQDRDWLRVAQMGIDLCRKDEWAKGAPMLKGAADHLRELQAVPQCFYSYLGCCLAGLEGRNREGLALCEKAIDLEFYQPENYLNLARIYAAAGQPRKVMAAINRGLEIDPGHPALVEMHSEHYTRRPSLLTALPREHVVNQWLGKVRHRVAGEPDRD